MGAGEGYVHTVKPADAQRGAAADREVAERKVGVEPGKRAVIHDEVRVGDNRDILPEPADWSVVGSVPDVELQDAAGHLDGIRRRAEAGVIGQIDRAGVDEGAACVGVGCCEAQHRGVVDTRLHERHGLTALRVV